MSRLAAMFSDSSRRFNFGGNSEPWFRIGTLDVGSAGVLSFVVLFGFLLSAFEGPSNPATKHLYFGSSEVFRGEIWRIFTWMIPNVIEIWPLLSIAMIFYIGSMIEGTLGRDKMVKFLAVLVVIPVFSGLIVHVLGLGPFAFAGGRYIAAGLIYTIVVFMPGIRSFFGIPLWIIVAVFVAIEALQHVGNRYTAGLIFLFLRVGFVFLAAKAFGLANEISWIPDLRTVMSGVGQSGTSQAPASAGKKRRGRRSKKDAPRPMVAVDSSFEEMGIDEILDQISAFGMDSLNSSQRKKLDAYSKGRKKDS